MEKKRLQRYLEYNRERKVKAMIFNEAKADFLFKIIPFLLHSNYPDLPGYVDDAACPFGIHLLDPRRRVDSELFGRFFPLSTALHEKTPDPFAAQPFIHSLKTIGSIGTIAQTEKSDCDYWLSIREEETGPEGIPLLRKKCSLIEQWALARGHEIHFFLMDITQTRNNTYQAQTDQESAGSALKLLLKDELFRSHILVAGKMLLWWLIPPGLTREGYQIHVSNLLKNRQIKRDHFIDLGYMTDIPREEIFGACLWQMNKALDSPFKSIIKFAYLELLLNDREQLLPLFSDRIKTLVTFPEERAGGLDHLRISEVDPYLLLAREIVAFYQRDRRAATQADLIRECLYLKTLEGMASQRKKKKSAAGYRQTMVLMKNWQLLPANSKYFSSFLEWEYHDLISFGQKVHRYLIETYKRLRSTFRVMEGKLTISQRDIAVLGRKLFTFYEEKPDKIEYIRSLSREIMARDVIIFQARKVDGVLLYYAFQDASSGETPEPAAAALIAKDQCMIRLVTGLIINGILTRETAIDLDSHSLSISRLDIEGLIDKIFSHFPPVNFGKISAAKLLQEETVVKALIVVNFEKKQDVSAGKLRSAIITFTSFGEYFIRNYYSLASLKEARHLLLTGHLVSRWNHNLDYHIPAQPGSHQIKNMLFT